MQRYGDGAGAGAGGGASGSEGILEIVMNLSYRILSLAPHNMTFDDSPTLGQTGPNRHWEDGIDD